MYHKFLFKMVAIVVVLAGVEIPASNFVTIHSIVSLLAHESAPVILGQESAIRLLPRLILDVSRIKIFLKCWNLSILNVGATSRKRGIIETP